MDVSVNMYWCGHGGSPHPKHYNSFEVHVTVDGRTATGIFGVPVGREPIDKRYYRLKEFIGQLIKDCEPPPNLSNYWW